MRYKIYIFTAMMISNVFSQGEISLKSVLDGTFSTESIGRYTWKNSTDSYYFSKKSDSGLDFYIYNLASNDTTKSFSIPKSLINNFSYSFSPNQKKLLLKKNSVKIWRHSSYGSYYIYDIESSSLTSVTSNPDRLRNVKFSPDSENIAFVREDNNLYLFSLASNLEEQLTFDGSENILNGHFGWVYEEEFGTYDSYKWSPNSKHIAFIREDQTYVKKYPLVDYESQYPVVKYIRYPKTGEDNPVVSISILDLENKEYRSVNLPDTAYYIPDIIWQDNSENLFFATLNRKQNDWNLYRYDFAMNNGELILNDSNDSWIDRDPFTVPQEIGTWTTKGGFSFAILESGEIIWLSERDGFKHIYRSRPDGRFLNQITRGEWEVSTINAIDYKKEIIYFTGKKETETENHLYSVRFNGSKLKRITKENGSHSAAFSPTLNYFINGYSSLTIPPKTFLRQNSGKIVRVLKETDKSKFDNLGLTYPQLINIFADDGTRLNALITYPHNFDPMKQYPVILYNYGGPGSQLVMNRWGAGSHTLHQFFASRDFIIFSFDNRGTGGRGKAFKDLAYGDYGKYLVKDHISAAKYLQGLTYVDADNIGIWGWSGGGYLTNMCMTLASDYYKAGISIAPNVEPLLYDTIWTERYMGLIEENPEGYKNASVLTHVDKAKGHLLQIHGNADDNVHHQHSLKLAKAYAEHGKDMEMFIYPNANHGMYNNNFLTQENPADGWKNRYHLYKKMTDFFIEHLVPETF
jgi:dipeptidyl-peptidase-4